MSLRTNTIGGLLLGYVERIEISKDGLSDWVEIPEKAKRGPESYHLALSDSQERP